MKFGLSDKDFSLVLSMAIEPLKKRGAKVWVFGSRANEHYKDFSDLDLLFEFSHRTPEDFIFSIKDDLEQSDLSIKIDLVDRKTLAESYKQEIENQKVEV